jgi:uncharacterized lipoprotein YmbA
MKCLLALVAAALLSGCAGDQQEQEFFYRGWINPNRPAAKNFGAPMER